MGHCLIVDDSRTIRRVERKMIEALGFDACEAEDGHDALAQCAVEMPALVLLDWVMPNMDGLAVIRAAHELRPGLPAVLLTGYAGDLDTMAGARTGSYELVRKPVSPSQLAARVTAILAAHIAVKA